MTAATAIWVIKFLKHPENSFQMYVTVQTTKSFATAVQAPAQQI